MKQQKLPDLRYYDDYSHTIDDNYVDSVNLTHGQRPRRHIGHLKLSMT